MTEFNAKMVPFMNAKLSSCIEKSGFTHRIHGIKTPEFAAKDYAVDKKTLTVTASQRLISKMVEVINNGVKAVRFLKSV